MRRYEPPAGMTCQPFKFALDATDEQAGALFSHFGARRYAYNWTVEQLRRHRFCYVAYKRRSESVPEIVSGPLGYAYDWRAMRSAPAYPDRRDLRKQWNVEKHQRCVNAESGEVWWPQNSKEAYANGIFDACDAFDKWARSCAEGGKVGFPKFKKRGSDCDRYRISTGALRLDGRRHVVIPRVGRVRTHENMRKLARLVEKGPERAKIRSATIRRRGTRIEIVFAVDVARPQSTNQVADPASVVGVDVGVRRLATVADDRGEVIARHPNPRALDCVLDEIRVADRRRSRCVNGSRRYRERSRELGALHARARNIRSNCLHHITTDLAKSHGTTVAEGAVWSALAQQKHLLGARTRRRQLHDAAPGEIRRQLGYKTRWYGSQLIIADKFYPSSKTCSQCGHVQNIGWAAKWTCAQCETVHDRDDNAAVNLAAYPQRDNAARCECGCRRSPVGASVKRSPKARPEPATTPLGNGAGTGDKPKTATAPSDAERFTRSGNATGRASRQGHANQGTPNQRGVSGTPRRGTQIKAPTNA